MKKGPASRVFVKPGDVFRLQYAVWIHGEQNGRQPDLDAAYAQYLKLVESGR
jgi:hypothetical protein